MNIVFPGIDQSFSCEEGKVWTIVVENQRLMYKILSDINIQLQGYEGETVVSEDNKVLRVDRNVEQITQFIPFDLNHRNLLNKMIGSMQKTAINDDYIKTKEILGMWEKYMMELSLGMPGNIIFSKITEEALIKAAGPEFADEYETLGEKLIDYIELVEEYDKKKLFVLVNLHSFISQDEMEAFLETIIMRGYQLVLLENKEYPLTKYESRFIVDADLCNIC